MKYRVKLEFRSEEMLIIEANSEEQAERIAIEVSSGPVDNEVYDTSVSEYDGPKEADNT